MCFFFFEISIKTMTLLWPSKNCKTSRIGTSYYFYCYRFENVSKIITLSTGRTGMGLSLRNQPMCLTSKDSPCAAAVLFIRPGNNMTPGLAYGSCHGRIIAKSLCTQAKRINSYTITLILDIILSSSSY